MDEIDQKILEILQKNDKVSFEQMQNDVKMAPSSIHNRIKKMKNSGVIKQFSAIVDPEKVGFETIAMLGLSVEPTKIKKVAKKIAGYKQVQVVAISSGDHDIIVQILSKNDKELWRFINSHIKTIEGIRPGMDVSNFIEIFKMTQEINF